MPRAGSSLPAMPESLRFGFFWSRWPFLVSLTLFFSYMCLPYMPAKGSFLTRGPPGEHFTSITHTSWTTEHTAQSAASKHEDNIQDVQLKLTPPLADWSPARPSQQPALALLEAIPLAFVEQIRLCRALHPA